MKKNTINKILISVIVFLMGAICILAAEIIRRPRYINISEPETTVIEEAVADATTTVDSSTDQQAVGSAEPDTVTTALRGKTSTKVNIRDSASDQARVLTTVDEGYEFDIVEIQDNGWTKIKYEDQDAYISSSYVIVIQ